MIASRKGADFITGIVKLNVGGARFETTADTLTRITDSFFSRLLSGAPPPPSCFVHLSLGIRLVGSLGSTVDEHGAYFIDRDGQFFAPILTFLRTGDVSVPRGMPLSALRREAEFFCVGALVKALDELEAAPSPAVRADLN